MLCVIIPGAIILFLLLVVATPSFIRARKQSQRNARLNNSRQVDGVTDTQQLDKISLPKQQSLKLTEDQLLLISSKEGHNE